MILMVPKLRVIAAVVAGVFLFVATAHSADPAQRCEARKLRKSGRYGACRLTAEAKAVSQSTVVDYSTCEATFSTRWNVIETRAGSGVCPSEGDETLINDRVTLDGAEIATLLAGAELPTCGDASIDEGEQCDGDELDGADCVALGFTGGALACDSSCFYDLSACTSAGAGLVPGVDPILTTSGQTSAFGAGSDGAVQAGAAPSYTDNGDGTITDDNTGLMWEKKDDSGGIHDMNDFYFWSSGDTALDGSIVTTFLDTLNDVGGDGSACFAGHCDWRLPNVKELVSILDLERSGPSIDPAFHQTATCTGCQDVTLVTCSCTASSLYWSSTTVAASALTVWYVEFNNGIVFTIGKGGLQSARAVRGGL